MKVTARSSLAILFCGAFGAACGRDPPPPAACPPGATADHERAADILARLKSVPEGAEILERSASTGAVTLCFGARAPNGLTPGRVALLEADLPPAEAAARTGHLLLHAVEGLPFEDTPTDAPTTATTVLEDCPSRVERAVAAEARGFDLELRLRQKLGVQGARLASELEQVYWRAPEGERLSVIASYLREHPDGAPGMEGIVGGYSRRCQKANR